MKCKFIEIVLFCLMIFLSSCIRKTSINKKSIDTQKQEVQSDSCSLGVKLVKKETIEVDVPKEKMTTWGITEYGTKKIGDKDNINGLPNIPGLYVAKRWCYCKNDSCNTGYYVIGVKCPKEIAIKRWVSKQIWKEMKENGNKEVKRLFVENPSVSQKQIVDFYMNDWKKHYDYYLNHFLICEHVKTPTEQFGLFIMDVWKHEALYTMCVYSWYDMATCGCSYRTYYYTISALSGKVLTSKDIVRKEDYTKIEELLKKELAVQIYHKSKSKMQDVSFLDKQDGIALISEGLVIYFHPYSIGRGYDGQYNVVITYDELKENNIKLKVR